MSNYVFIDAQNLYYGIKSLGWKLDYRKFRIYLKEKYNVETAYLFMGKIAEYKHLYFALQKVGFRLCYKEVTITKDGSVKGNVDVELVLQTMIDYHNYDKALIVSSDGDFCCLVNYLYNRDKLKLVMSPHINTCSIFLKKAAKEKIIFLDTLRIKIEYKSKNKKAPH
jgi:uncharacterized LabA/DUF88 family protein